MTRYTTLIAPDELLALQAAGQPVVIIDCGFDLADTGAGERAHAAGHIAGAAYAHLERDLSGSKAPGKGRHPLPQRAAFAATAGRLGAAPGVQVVTYDAQGGPYAARRIHEREAPFSSARQRRRERAGAEGSARFRERPRGAPDAAC